MSGLEDKNGSEAKGVKSKRSADKEDEVEGAKRKKSGAPTERLTVRSSAVYWSMEVSLGCQRNEHVLVLVV